MSLAAHKFIDALLLKRGELQPIPYADRKDDERVAEEIRLSEKFDFGDLMLERMNGGAWHLPKLTDDEVGFWRDGLIPLPFDSCWYEFILGGFRSGLLVQTKVGGAAWVVERLDLVGDSVTRDAITARAVLAEASAQMPVQLGGNLKFAEMIAGNKLFVNSNLGAMMPLAIYLTLMLVSKSTEVERGLLPAKLNKANVRRGYEPLPEHRVVRIVPNQYRYERDPVTGKGHHRSPRLHWRRSHLRHYEGGKVIVIARMLVGRAELGEVSHEYQIVNSEGT